MLDGLVIGVKSFGKVGILYKLNYNDKDKEYPYAYPYSRQSLFTFDINFYKHIRMPLC